MSNPEPTTPVPEWFLAALAQRPEHRQVTVAGTSIAYRTWGRIGGRGIVLVHGGSAHAGWWDHVAPLLCTAGRVVAVDLSGHGDSGRREDGYTLEGWVDELFAAAEDAGAGGRPVVVGHSMGGMVGLRAGAVHGERMSGLIIVDTPIRPFDAQEQQLRERRSRGTPRRYADRASAVARFRPLPDQGRPMLQYVLRHVAEQSVTTDGDEWTWKYDPRTFLRKQLSTQDVEPVGCRSIVLRAEHGRLLPDLAHQLCRRLGGAAEVVLPDAGHHVMLDRPLVLVSALRSVLAQWDMT